EALKVHLTDDALPRSEKPVDIAAYNLFLQARNNVRARTRQSLELALTQFQQALDQNAFIEGTIGVCAVVGNIANMAVGDQLLDFMPNGQATNTGINYQKVGIMHAGIIR
ncbi:MAG: hypothetical protein ACPGZU_04840, partial [Ketobacter sp.]